MQLLRLFFRFLVISSAAIFTIKFGLCYSDCDMTNMSTGTSLIFTDHKCNVKACNLIQEHMQLFFDFTIYFKGVDLGKVNGCRTFVFYQDFYLVLPYMYFNSYLALNEKFTMINEINKSLLFILANHTSIITSSLEFIQTDQKRYNSAFHFEEMHNRFNSLMLGIFSVGLVSVLNDGFSEIDKKKYQDSFRKYIFYVFLNHYPDDITSILNCENQIFGQLDKYLQFGGFLYDKKQLIDFSNNSTIGFVIFLRTRILDLLASIDEHSRIYQAQHYLLPILYQFRDLLNVFLHDLNVFEQKISVFSWKKYNRVILEFENICHLFLELFNSHCARACFYIELSHLQTILRIFSTVFANYRSVLTTLRHNLDLFFKFRKFLQLKFVFCSSLQQVYMTMPSWIRHAWFPELLKVDHYVFRTSMLLSRSTKQSDEIFEFLFKEFENPESKYLQHFDRRYSLTLPLLIVSMAKKLLKNGRLKKIEVPNTFEEAIVLANDINTGLMGLLKCYLFFHSKCNCKICYEHNFSAFSCEYKDIKKELTSSLLQALKNSKVVFKANESRKLYLWQLYPIVSFDYYLNINEDNMLNNEAICHIEKEYRSVFAELPLHINFKIIFKQ